MQEKTKKIVSILANDFPNPKSELKFENTYQLIVSVILSAQCTDKRVNQITPSLFKIADTPQKLANMDIEQLEKIIFSCGFYHSKAKHLIAMAKDVIEKFDGKIPSTISQLMTLSGVGKKTANVVFSVGFGGQAIAVDTHVFRVSNRLGLTHAKNVSQTEKQLTEQLEQNMWGDCHHYLLLHGRYVCKSRRPMCAQCHLNSLCEYFSANTNNTESDTDKK